MNPFSHVPTHSANFLTNLPHNLSEENFRRFESYLRLAVQVWPKESCFAIDSTLAPTTFVARFRDSLVSLRRYGWATNVDTQKLSAIAGQFTIQWEAGSRNVWFRQKHRPGAPAKGLAGPESLGKHSQRTAGEGSSSNSVVLPRDITAEAIVALCVLVNQGYLQGPFIVQGRHEKPVGGFDNVAFHWNEQADETVVT